MTETLTARQLADQLDVTKVTISRWRRDGFLPKATAVPGKPLCWSTDAIETWRAELEYVETWADRMRELTIQPRLHRSFRAFAKAGCNFLQNIRVPLKARHRMAGLMADVAWDRGVDDKPSAKDVATIVKHTRELEQLHRDLVPRRRSRAS